jgi:hypothetical protein
MTSQGHAPRESNQLLQKLMSAANDSSKFVRRIHEFSIHDSNEYAHSIQSDQMSDLIPHGDHPLGTFPRLVDDRLLLRGSWWSFIE